MNILQNLKERDPVISNFINSEKNRQETHLELIASENFASIAVMQAQGSVLTNIYAEGLPQKRYYGGCEFVDEIEELAIQRAKKLFNANWANVQPHSGAQANAAGFLSLLKPGDTIMGMDLSHGGHLTHGSPVNMSGKWFNAVHYGVNKETSELFLSLKKFSEEGILIIYITHKLKEVMQLCDEVAVMRRGKLVSVSQIKDENIESLANKMVGQNLKTIKKTKEKTSSEQLIKITNLNFISEDPFETNLSDINFSVNRGECLGIAGISGNGQSELFQVLSGEIISDKNSIEFNKNFIGDLNPQERREYLMAFSPEDRLEQAAIPQMAIFENVALNNFKSSNFFNNGLINESKIKEHSKKIISDFNVNTDNIDLKSQFLSGGNLQKLIIGRELITSPDLLICFNPTWGLDVGAINYIHETLIKINEQNKSIILISTDTDELLKLSDKISVIHKGKLSKIMNADEVTSEKLGILMGGGN